MSLIVLVPVAPWPVESALVARSPIVLALVLSALVLSAPQRRAPSNARSSSALVSALSSKVTRTVFCVSH